MDLVSGDFEWDLDKEGCDLQKHGIEFRTAAKAFKDPRLKIYADSSHSTGESRFFCIGKVADRVITVRFVYRHGRIRIFGAGCWRKGARYYEKDD